MQTNAHDEVSFEFYRVTNDVNGNPRYVIHYLAFDSDYNTAKEKASSIGFKVYKGKSFGGGFVCQSYNLKDTAQQIIGLRS
jgi:hypothetical protein